MSVAVLGAGAFGTALAISLAQGGAVTLWARNDPAAQAMAASRENPRLPGVPLPAAIHVSGDLAHAVRADTLLLAVPTQSLPAFLEQAAPHLSGQRLVACCKGVEMASGLGPVALLDRLRPGGAHALLTGPSFASDIALGLPTALTLACRDDHAGAALQQALTTPNLRLYRTTDVTGAELGGALKNVIAIACGAVIGAGLGESARAALMTRGFAEIQRMAAARGARPETLAGLSGFGDLVLTCGSAQSRNFRLGLALGKGQPFDPAITVEGAATARAVHAEAARTGSDMPITGRIVALLDGQTTVTAAMSDLLSRPLRQE